MDWTYLLLILHINLQLFPVYLFGLDVYPFLIDINNLMTLI